MPCKKSGDKWKLGSGPAMYTSKENCEKAYAAYLAKKYNKSKGGKKDGKAKS